MSSMRSLARLSSLVLALALAGPAACTRSAPSPAPTDTSPQSARDRHADAPQPADSTTASANDPAAGAAIATSDGHSSAAVTWKTSVKPKPISNNVQMGVQWLLAHQLPNGGWGQGDEAPQMRGNQAAQRATANVADTAMSLMALMRAGSTPSEGPHAAAISRGLGFILSEIEASDDKSLYVTSVRGTRVQGKIGTYVDTFTSLIVLTEAKGKMADAKQNARLQAALAKVVDKIESNQREDGTWGNQGWAPVLTQSMAAKGLNRAAQSGEVVADDTLRRVEKQAQEQFDPEARRFAGEGSAGIGLYAGAANSASLRDSMNTRKAQEPALRKRRAEAKTERERAAVDQQIADNKSAEDVAKDAERALLERLDEPSFIQGFGNNGGEEFLSYMLVSEALVAEGGHDWEQWDQKITALMNRVQNGDGSWTGHHCITGRTFCTAAALLVLMADRTPVPVASQIQAG